MLSVLSSDLFTALPWRVLSSYVCIFLTFNSPSTAILLTGTDSYKRIHFGAKSLSVLKCLSMSRRLGKGSGWNSGLCQKDLGSWKASPLLPQNALLPRGSPCLRKRLNQCFKTPVFVFFSYNHTEPVEDLKVTNIYYIGNVLFGNPIFGQFRCI